MRLLNGGDGQPEHEQLEQCHTCMQPLMPGQPVREASVGHIGPTGKFVPRLVHIRAEDCAPLGVWSTDVSATRLP